MSEQTLTFQNGPKTYTTQWTRNNDTISIGSPPCITLRRLTKKEFAVETVQRYNEESGNQLSCFDSPATGLDQLMNLAFAFLLNQTSRPIVHLTDEAKAPGLRIPLSFQKILDDKMPTYYKYGFKPTGMSDDSYREWVKGYKKVIESHLPEIEARFASKFSFGNMGSVLVYLDEIGHPYLNELEARPTSTRILLGGYSRKMNNTSYRKSAKRRGCRRNTRRTVGGDSVGYGFGGSTLPAVNNYGQVYTQQNCNAAVRPGTLGGQDMAGASGLPGMRGGRYQFAGEVLPSGLVVSGAGSIPCEASRHNPLNAGTTTPTTQSGGVAFLEETTAGYSQLGSAGAVGRHSDGTPFMLNVPDGGRLGMSASCVKTGGRRRRGSRRGRKQRSRRHRSRRHR